MGRPHDPDDADDDYGHRPPARPSASPALVVALAVGGAALLGALACAGFLLLSARAARDAAQERAAVRADAAAAKPAKGGTRVYTREEFRDLVMGKTPDEVAAALGRPDETSEAGGVVRWTYRGRVRDPAPGEAPATPVAVVFRDGQVAEVND
jgi:hypothetical protein